MEIEVFLTSTSHQSHENIFLSIILIVLLVLLVLPALSSADDRGSRRKDYNFSNWKKLEQALLIEIKSVKDQKTEVRSLRQQYEVAEEKYHGTAKKGFLGFFDPKEDARKEMDKAHTLFSVAERRLNTSEEKVKDYLTSTPPGNRLSNFRNYEPDNEAIELRNALIIVQATAESLGGMLQIDKTNSLAALEYYDSYLELLGYLQAMHASFIQRAEGKYYDQLKSLWGGWLKHSADIRRITIRDSTDNTDTLMQRKLEENKKITAKIPELVKALAKMKTWAQNNLNKIREKKIAVSLLKDHAFLAKNTKDFVGDIDATFLSLGIEEPPLVEFSVDIENFSLTNVPG